MIGQNRIVLFLMVLNCILSSYFLGLCKVLVKKFENCDQNKNYSAKFNFTLQTSEDKQYVNIGLVLTAPVDNSLKHNVSFEMLVGDEFVYLFSINERKSCNALNKYFGELWYDIERHAGIIPGLCPIAKGTYQLHNYLLDWNKMATLRNFPLGHLRIVFTVYGSKNSIFTCFVLEEISQH